MYFNSGWKNSVRLVLCFIYIYRERERERERKREREIGFYDVVFINSMSLGTF